MPREPLKEIDAQLDAVAAGQPWQLTQAGMDRLRRAVILERAAKRGLFVQEDGEFIRIHAPEEQGQIGGTTVAGFIAPASLDSNGSVL